MGAHRVALADTVLAYLIAAEIVVLGVYFNLEDITLPSAAHSRLGGKRQNRLLREIKVHHFVVIAPREKGDHRLPLRVFEIP
jgi:hypothetical protein